jgi:hypothetical protein
MERGFLVRLFIFFAFFMLAVPGFAGQIDGLQFHLFDLGTSYYGPASSGEFFIYEDRSWENSQNGGILVDYYSSGGTWEDYELRSGTIDITSAPLLNDTSYEWNTMNPWIARGEFGGAGSVTLTISGSLWETKDGQPGTEIFSGAILTAILTESFEVSEKETPQIMGSSMDAQMIFQITGGELKTGTVTGLSFATNQITLDMLLVNCTQQDQPGMFLTNFQSDIDYLNPSEIQINPLYSAPEPGTAVLMVLSSLFLRSKKKKLNSF